MDTTSPSLLQKLRENSQPEAWKRFVDLYTPLLLAWARRAGLQAQDAADLVQEVFATLVHQLPKFQYDPHKKNFRGWLRTVCMNKWRDRGRRLHRHPASGAEADLEQVPAAPELEQSWEREHDQYLVRQALKCLEELQTDFEPRTLDVCREVLLNNRPPADVARDFGITENAVYIAKLRVLRRLRQELAEFLE